MEDTDITEILNDIENYCYNSAFEPPLTFIFPKYISVLPYKSTYKELYSKEILFPF